MKCNESCPFCAKALETVQQFVRHPRTCTKRKKLAIPESVSKKQKTLSDEASNDLRNALMPIQRSDQRRQIKDTNSINNATTLAKESSHNTTVPVLSLPPTSLAVETDPAERLPLRSPGDGPESIATTCIPHINPSAHSKGQLQAERPPINLIRQRAPASLYLGADGGTFNPQSFREGRRAPTLYNSLIDGVDLSIQNETRPGPGILDPFRQDSSIIHRAPALNNSLLDGTFIPVPCSTNGLDFEFSSAPPVAGYGLTGMEGNFH